uniref:Uncharacterized protein n=1 Tax=Globisporangium ultimum (strain ATCC 200006 / CBS 805.95 / DAOM BR144) TaxID=431595 RepID=K3WDY3_GLOUD
MSVASNDTTQDMTLDTTIPATSPHSAPSRSNAAGRLYAHNRGATAVSKRSVLSLDDLSNESKGEDSGDDDGDGDLERPGSNSTTHVEDKLQHNLRKQQEHYARQRKLFEDLRNDPTAGGRSSPRTRLPSSSDSMHSNDSQRSPNAIDTSDSKHEKRPRRATQQRHGGRRGNTTMTSVPRFQLDLETELTGISLKRQEPVTGKRLPEYQDENSVLRELSRIKVNATTEYQRRMADTQHSQANRLRGAAGMRNGPRPSSTTSKLQPDLVDELSHQEASNEALRKQLELLRRLQVENNRFRHDTRAAREQNEVLEEQNQLQKCEIKRLREDIKELAEKIEQDQQRLVAAAQTNRKLKQCQKQLHAAERDVEKLQSTLQESLDHQEQLQVKTLRDMNELTTECKRLKRSVKQLKQQETQLSEENELLKSSIEALESQLAEVKDELHDEKRATSELSTQMIEKTSQCDTIEASATACVQRMETGMEALQKAFDAEREKRKKGDAQRHNLQARLDKVEIESRRKSEHVDKLDHRIVQLQERLNERKIMLEQQKQHHDEKIEEFLDKQSQDLKAIASLRVEFESVEQQLESERTSSHRLKKQVAIETRAIRKELEGLRKYIETSMQGGTPRSALGADEHGDNDSDLNDDDKSGPHSRFDVGSGGAQALPELQFLQGATSALLTEMMNFVHEFQRAKHVLRQLGKKLTLSQERATELEHLRGEDALKIQELREQCRVSEQAREIMSNEKLEILQWSQQTCEKNESLESELQACEHFLQLLRSKLKRHGRRPTRNRPDDDCEEGEERSTTRSQHTKKKPESAASRSHNVSQSFKSIECAIELLVATQQELTEALNQSHQERDGQESMLQNLQQELESKASESERVLAEVEALHTKSAKEQKAHMENIVAELESEKRELIDNIRARDTQLEAVRTENAALQTRVEDLEQDVPVFVAILHLFVLVVQPLILQVSELLSQKRYLLRENAEYAHAHEQIECIGHVLKELVPMQTMVNEINAAKQQRHKRFRRVVVAIFALNRFQKCGFIHQQQEVPGSEAAASGTFGVCTSLKPPKQKKRASAKLTLHRNPPLTVIKVLPPRSTLTSLKLRQLLLRFSALGITDKVAKLVDCDGSHSPSSTNNFGKLLVQVLACVDPGAKELLMDNTNGAFHCQALLEQTTTARHSQRHRQQSTSSSGEEELSTVDLIRKRILALGKRVEDLHYQRNVLQKDNYEFQFQLEQQATQLKEVDALNRKTQELKQEIQDLRTQGEQIQQQTTRQLDAKQEQLDEKVSELQVKEQELVHANAAMRSLESEIAAFQERLDGLEDEKRDLHTQMAALQQRSLEQEEKSEIAKVGVKRQEDEVRNLKQAAKKAHELYQKMNWQLEQEILERANVQASMDQLKRQKELLEKELHEAKLRDLEKSFSGDSSSQEHVQETEKRAKQHVRFATSASSESSVSSSYKENSYSSGRNKPQEVSPSMLENTCLYHKYEKPHSRKQPPSADSNDGSLNRNNDESDDEDESDSKSDLQSSSHSSHFHLPPSPRRGTDAANNKFLNEWRRLQIASAFDDDAGTRQKARQNPPTMNMKKPVDEANTQSNATSVNAATSKQIAREVEIDSNRRRIEIDKVNSAVHDYMDRIDEKLQQMYGIPPSSASSRLRAGGKEHSDGDDHDASSDGDVGGSGFARSSRISKPEEVRPTHWYG